MPIRFAVLNLFFYMAVLSEIVAGVAYLSVLGLSVLGRDYLESLEYMGVGVSLFLIGFGLSLLWLKKHFLMGMENLNGE
jgi:hypothetical protein